MMSNAGLLVLTVLGSASPYPTRDNACSGYLVRHDDTNLSPFLTPEDAHARAATRYDGHIGYAAPGHTFLA